ncbi:SpvB/TcaC N-terminal domain-containing protein [Cohnella herbarum]|uniref:Toxin n=1 Tax=Cohnella herbarum TaxID=2728023 RepID=A0A7Z2VR05_9BACL|nr:SpvB/TcaC N-terminal domain-containing protein [Cohnella herbarum]QJD87672.1 hypothetical protein HH215_33800 [Cohnella herbarum]
MKTNEDSNKDKSQNTVAAPSISLPKGGGAIRGIGEKFAANPVTGTGSLTVPLAVSPSRNHFGPKLALSYDSGTGNGPFGFGWNLSLPAIVRKTDKGLPQYRDAEESDVYMISGAEDLVPVSGTDGNGTTSKNNAATTAYRIDRYRPRNEGAFARIERWTDQATGMIHWRSISRDNVTSFYGKTEQSRIADPRDPARRVYSWLICESFDDKGNAIVYEYAEENGQNVDETMASERSRERVANRYVKRIKYGNRVSRLTEPDLTRAEWMFEAVFDYDEGHCEAFDPQPHLPESDKHKYVRAAIEEGRVWSKRIDPFSSYRAGFEVRTYRRCRRLLMFHRFAELGSRPCLVRSTEFTYGDFDYTEPYRVENELSHRGSSRMASFIQTVTQSGYVRQPQLEQAGDRSCVYMQKSLPPLEFTYSKAGIQEEIRELDFDTLANLPVGLDGSAYRWVDLEGEGLSGILTEQGGAWFYKPNLGSGTFGTLKTVTGKPSMATLGGRNEQLFDLDGDGRLEWVSLSGAYSGYAAHDGDGQWGPYQTFSQMPNVAWDDPHLRFIDLNGDGQADALITADDVFTWYPSLGAEGFGSAHQVDQPADEENGPSWFWTMGRYRFTSRTCPAMVSRILCESATAKFVIGLTWALAVSEPRSSWTTPRASIIPISITNGSCCLPTSTDPGLPTSST